ncbi:hypothetical protein B4168_3873 [Anoxybacillus flavithermus]|nr:hypothetical protein B4168_3873 [Anoxybacillus flavithermus]OAO87942.1 hypothetical protein GT23_0675 [Parageobacillus thermoglucosidasius]
MFLGEVLHRFIMPRCLKEKPLLRPGAARSRNSRLYDGSEGRVLSAFYG